MLVSVLLLVFVVGSNAHFLRGIPKPDVFTVESWEGSCNDTSNAMHYLAQKYTGVSKCTRNWKSKTPELIESYWFLECGDTSSEYFVMTVCTDHHCEENCNSFRIFNKQCVEEAGKAYVYTCDASEFGAWVLGLAGLLTGWLLYL